MKSRAFKAANANSVARWFWYFIIGVCFVLVLVVWASSSPTKFDHGYDGWAQLAILTAGVFGYLLKWGWRYSRRARFWRLYSITFLVHCAVFAALFAQGRWHVLLLALVGSCEIMALAAVIALAMGDKL